MLRIAFALALAIVAPLSSAHAAAVLGIVYTSMFETGTVLPEGQGIGLNSLVVVNLGDEAVDLAELAITATLLDSSSAVGPTVGATVSGPLVLEAGTAAGYLNGDVVAGDGLAFIRQTFPATTTFEPRLGLFSLTLSNPLGSGETLDDLEARVTYRATLDGSTFEWVTTWRSGVDDLEPGQTRASVAFLALPVAAAAVPEPSAVFLFGVGIFLATRGAHMVGSSAGGVRGLDGRP